jgi:hypothetical protein
VIGKEKDQLATVITNGKLETLLSQRKDSECGWKDVNVWQAAIEEKTRGITRKQGSD